MSPLILLNGVIVDTPSALTDRIRVSVPDLVTMPRQTYGPLRFDPIVSGQGGTRIPQSGDTAVVGIDEGTGEQWVVRWHRDDATPPPYNESGGNGGGGGSSGGMYAQTIGNGVAQSFAINHFLSSRDVAVEVYRMAPPYDMVEANVEHTSLNSLTVRTLTVPSASEYRVVVIGGIASGGTGPSGPVAYTHTQGTPSAIWNVVHSLPFRPNVSVVDSGDSTVLPSIHYTSDTQIDLNFGSATSGKAYLS